MAYHEGSFWPIASVLAFHDFLARALSQPGGGRSASVEKSLSKVGRWPEELWLQAYVANHDQSYAAALARGPLLGWPVGQLCWRDKSHFPNGTSQRLVEGIRDGSLKGSAQWYASKVQRGLQDPVTRGAVEGR